MATFEASKKLLKETIDNRNQKQAVAGGPVEIVPPEQNSLLRKLEIFEGEGQSLRLLHTVVCNGFNAAAPRLIYSAE